MVVRFRVVTFFNPYSPLPCFLFSFFGHDYFLSLDTVSVIHFPTLGPSPSRSFKHVRFRFTD